MSAANGFRTDFAKTEVPHFAFLDQVSHGSGDFFDGHVRIEPVLIKQIDDLDLEAFERVIGHPTNAIRAAVEAVWCSHFVTELGADHHFLAQWSKRVAHEFFIDERAICFGGVEECDAPLHCLADQLDHRLTAGVNAAMVIHAHATKAECGYLHAAAARTQSAALGNE